MPLQPQPYISAMQMPEVSVVIPAYNAEATLAETLDSALAQSLRDIEVIVIDDGSTDRTAAIAADANDPRVRVISVQNGGVARARNRGIHESRAELIAFLDADDLWRPTKLERQVRHLSGAPDSGLCVTAATRIDADSRELDLMPLLKAEDHCESLLRGSMIAGCISSGLLRKHTLQQVGGFNPEFSQCADWDLWLRVSLVTRISAVDDDLVLYRSRSNNMSSDPELLERDTFAVLEAFFRNPGSATYIRSRRRIYSNHWMICAGSYLHAWRIRAALRCVLSGLRADPANIGRPLGLPVRWAGRLTKHHGETL